MNSGPRRCLIASKVPAKVLGVVSSNVSNVEPSHWGCRTARVRAVWIIV